MSKINSNGFEMWLVNKSLSEIEEMCKMIFPKGVAFEESPKPLGCAEWFYGQVGRHKENSHEQD